jgi:release factor glutamine methyltransferase
MLLREHVGGARSTFLVAGIDPDEASLDARLLAASALGWDTARLLTEFDAPPPPGFESTYRDMVRRRALREPIAYILGRQEFWGLGFDVTPAVLIPRPETELIVEAVCARVPAGTTPIDVADIGTGSGCIAVALAVERPAARVTATDVSAEALAVAARNVQAHGLANRVRFVRADLFAGAPGPFDVIASNLPYVPQRDVAGLQPEVGQHEPAAALFGGGDGLDVIRRLVAQAAARLKPHGWLIFEFGFGQADAVRAIVADAPQLQLDAVLPDLQGIPRVAAVRRTDGAVS